MFNSQENPKKKRKKIMFSFTIEDLCCQRKVKITGFKKYKSENEKKKVDEVSFHLGIVERLKMTKKKKEEKVKGLN